VISAIVLNPNDNASFDAVMRLVKLPISENIPRSEPCSSNPVGSKLGLGVKSFESWTFNKLEAELKEGASVTAETASVAALFVAVRLELSLLE